MPHLTHEPIDTTRLLTDVASPQAGATVLFLGTTREFTDGRQTSSLDYESYDTMAESKLKELEDQARQRWPLVGVRIIHRLGHVPIGEISVAIAVSAAHRDDAFTGGKWLIDTIKQTVPIWKKENWADGGSEWVHPGTDSDQAGATSAELS